MPDWQYALTDPAVNRRSYPSIGWVLTNGSSFSSTMAYGGGDITPDPGDLSAVREAFGNISNAGIIRMSEKRDTFIAKKNAIVYDEAYNDGMVLVIVLENNNGDEVSVEIPNPDFSLFETDGVTMKQPLAAGSGGDTAQDLLLNAVTAYEALINNTFTPVNSYTFVRGYATSRKVSVNKPAGARPTIAEPGVGDSPGPEPASEPAV